ncbi:MAG: RNA polymerase sigma-54 factor [Planctomycetota bacterium]|nr:MAG: RNA polymerase sigma-54 factor [Planctomycetota bacterium]
MRLEYQQNLRLEQRLIQSPQMIQAMQILQLTTPELLERIEAELEDNPFLETEQGFEEVSDKGEENREEAEEGPLEDLPGLQDLDQLLEVPVHSGSRSRSAATEEGYDALQNVAAPEGEDLDSILGEYRVTDASEEQVLMAEHLLASLDARGFLVDGIEGLIEEFGYQEKDWQEVLESLREIGHPALGATDIRECFLLQLQAMEHPHPIAETLVQEHFDDLLANRLPQISKSLGVSLPDVRAAIELLGHLDSRPISDFEPDHTMRIVPDVIVETCEDGSYQIHLTRDGLPELRLSRSAREALDRAKKDGNRRMYEFLLKKIERARWFLDAVEQRRQTLRRIAQALVERQREFLDYGPERLRPLKMQEIAEAVGVHISTVSRAIRGKYAQTPQGILPLKSFFSGGQRTSGGGQRSRVSIQERIKEIIDAEDKSAPLSDEELVRILRDRDGVKVARRTVTKYRLALNIPSSTMRRSY